MGEGLHSAHELPETACELMYMYVLKEGRVHCLNQLLNRKRGELLHCPSCEDSVSL